MDVLDVTRARVPRRSQSAHPPTATPPRRSFSKPDPLRLGMPPPPWLSVPPRGYGGVESVVSALTEALVARGHDVTLFCAPGSVSSATVAPMLDFPHPDEIER